MLAFIERLSRAAQRAGWAGLYVGDISQPRGGPLTSGHRSHQIGLDVDIWLRPPHSLKLTVVAEREAIGSPSMVAANRLEVNSDWTATHARVFEAAARDRSVARIFVNAATNPPCGSGRNPPQVSTSSWATCTASSRPSTDVVWA